MMTSNQGTNGTTAVGSQTDNILSSGYTNVGDGHELYYENWGSSSGIPLMVLHGGPGASFNATHKALFDPRKHRVVFFDQRGCGRSKPAGAIVNNTTAQLIGDIDILRAKLGISGPMNLAGGSWGSTLGLLYAQHRPENVKEFMLWSTFLGTREETYAPLGKQTLDPKFPHPSAWKQFISHIPRRSRGTPRKIIEYALSVLNSPDAARAWELAVAYTIYDVATCNSPTFDLGKARAEAEDDPGVVHAARIQMHYFFNLFFIAEGQILNQIDRVRRIKACVVHGVDDWCTRPQASADLKNAYGKNMTVRYVKSGHLRSDPEMTKALREVADCLS